MLLLRRHDDVDYDLMRGRFVPIVGDIICCVVELLELIALMPRAASLDLSGHRHCWRIRRTHRFMLKEKNVHFI